MNADDLPKPHVEAYPRLNVREVRKQLLRGRSTVGWRLNDDVLVGIGRAELLDGHRIRLDTQFREYAHIRAYKKMIVLQCSIRKMDFDQEDLLTHCPLCDSRVRVILFINYEWTCVNCQLLVYRSKAVGDAVRQAERLAKFEEIIKRGRPKGMHTSTYLKLRQERGLLKIELGDHRPRANRAYADVITCCWSNDGPPLLNAPVDVACQERLGELGEDRADEVESGHDDEAPPDYLRLAGNRLFDGPALAETLDQQLLRFAHQEYRAMIAERRTPTRIRVRKRLAAKRFDLPPLLRPDHEIRILAHEGEPVGQARFALAYEGNADFFLIAPDQPVGRLPTAVVTERALLLETSFLAEEERFIPVLIEEERQLIEHLLVAQRQAVALYNRMIIAHVRRVVERNWNVLVGGEPDETEDVDGDDDGDDDERASA